MLVKMLLNTTPQAVTGSCLFKKEKQNAVEVQAQICCQPPRFDY